MIASLPRAVSGVPGAVYLGAVRTLWQQSISACQEVERLQAWSSSDGASTTSTSYVPHSLPLPGQPVRPSIQQHYLRQHQRSTPASFPLAQHHHHHYHRHHHLIPQTLQLQQFRAYRIPNRVAAPKVAYSERVGRPAPQPWPEFEAVKAPQGEVRWHRSVVRFPPEVDVQVEGTATQPGEAAGAAAYRTLVLSGKAGTIRLSFQDLDPTALLAFRLIHIPMAASAGGGGQQQQQPAAQQQPRRSLLVLASPNKARSETVVSELNKAIRGVMSGFLVGLTVKGVGYRMEPVEDPRGEVASRVPKLTYAQLKRRARAPGGAAPKPYYFEMGDEEKQNVTFPYNKPASAIRLKVGYSRAAVYPLPPHIRAFCLKPTLLYLYGLELDELQRVAAEIRAIRKPNPYTGNGVQYLDEKIKLKQRARAK